MWRNQIIHIAICLSFLFAVQLHAQGVLVARVYDVNNNEPLIGASVLIEAEGMGCTTDYHGTGVLSDISFGVHVLKVSYIGYRSCEQEFKLDAQRDTTFLDICLQSALPPDPDAVYELPTPEVVAEYHQRLRTAVSERRGPGMVIDSARLFGGRLRLWVSMSNPCDEDIHLAAPWEFGGWELMIEADSMIGIETSPFINRDEYNYWRASNYHPERHSIALPARFSRRSTWMDFEVRSDVQIPPAGYRMQLRYGWKTPDTFWTYDRVSKDPTSDYRQHENRQVFFAWYMYRLPLESDTISVRLESNQRLR